MIPLPTLGASVPRAHGALTARFGRWMLTIAGWRVEGSFPDAPKVMLIVAPHIVGAPQPDSFETAIPEGLHHQFVVAVTLTDLVFWLVLGAVVGVVRGRFTGTATSLRDSFA